MQHRDEKCERCGWKYPGFHICVDLSTPEPPPPKPKPSRPKAKRDYGGDAVKSTDEWRDNIRKGVNSFWASQRELNKSRDERIARRYSDDVRTVRELSAEFGLDQKTIMIILHRARDAGTLTIRPAAKRKKV